MKTSYQGKGGYSRSGSGKSYGGGAGSRGGFGNRGGFKPRGGNGFDKPELHDATCAGCGKETQVPFKPNGSKPVFCRNCFKKDDSNFAPKRFEKPAYGAKRSENRFDVSDDADFGARPAPARATAGPDFARIESRLASIEAKLDMLIDSVTVEEDDEDEDEEEGDKK